MSVTTAGDARGDAEDAAPKRRAVLDAALALFAERGFHGTTMPAVAARAGVGAGTIYRYFASKEELANALYRHWKTHLGAIFRTAHDCAAAGDTRTDGAGAAAFARLWRDLVVFAVAHPDAVRFLELHAHGDYLDEASREVSREVGGALDAFLVDWRRAGVLADAPLPVLRAIVWGSFRGVVRDGQALGADAAADAFPLDDATIALSGRRVWRAIEREGSDEGPGI